MHDDGSVLSESSPTERTSERSSGIISAALILVVVVAVFVRLAGLGGRSLWLDEFSTWHVSRMGFWESLRWGSELIMPPLYQFVLRCVTSAPHPPEWMLRMPAAICGMLLVPAAFRLGRILASRQVGLALAALVAFNVLQIEYSREARPYTMLVLGCTLSVSSWYLLVSQSRRGDFWMYVVATTLAFYAHSLVALTLAAEVIWWLFALRRGGGTARFRQPLVALLVSAVLCLPLVWRSIYYRTSISQAVDWIDPPTWERAAGTLGELTFGPLYMVVVVALAVAVLLRARKSRTAPQRSADEVSSDHVGFAPAGLLICWICCSWLGLMLLSWLFLPMTVTRYALPAGIPALLLPLVLAARIHRWGPIALATLIVFGTAPQWIEKCTTAEPGFRELLQYVRQAADPEADAVALVIGHSSAANWVDIQRLALKYYDLDDRPVGEIALDEHKRPLTDEVLADPRRLFLIVFRSDPIALILEAGRRVESFMIDGESIQQLPFPPYRLVKVAPQDNE